MSQFFPQQVENKSTAVTVSAACVRAAALLCCWLMCPTQARADIYQYTAPDGTPHFSDQPTDERFRLVLRTKPTSPEKVRNKSSTAPGTNNRHHFEMLVTAAALANRLDANLLHAVIHTESGYNPRAVSPKGAQGLMQLMPATARHYGVTDPFDAAQNVGGGARHLRGLLNQFSDNVELALAAYNAGAGAVMAYGRQIPPYKETAAYVPTVLRRYETLSSATTAR